MLTKNAIGNMINRYTAVLKKCRLLNVFGSLAMAGTLAVGGLGVGPCVGDALAAYTPTLDDATAKAAFITSIKALDTSNPLSIALPTSYTGSTWTAYADDLSTKLSSASSAYTTTNDASTTYLSFTSGYETTTVVGEPSTEAYSEGDTESITTETSYDETTGVRTITTTEVSIADGKTTTTTTTETISPITTNIALTPSDSSAGVASIGDYITGYTTSKGYTFTTTETTGTYFTLDGTKYYVINGTSDGTYYIGQTTTTTTNMSKSGGTVAYTSGGGLHLDSGTTTVTGDFIANYAEIGGALYNAATITITSDFIGNYTHDTSDDGYADGSGSAIYNTSSGEISSLYGDFIGNFASGAGTIYNQGTITLIVGDFIGNEVTTHGGAIYNDEIIGTIIGDFIGNTATGTAGAIYNFDTISTIIGDFINNSSGAAGGAIANFGSATIGIITGNFIGNESASTGGAIINIGKIDTIDGDFYSNTAVSGGAIWNGNANGNITTITGDFYANTATSSGGAIYNINTIETLSGDFYSNTAGEQGGAIWNGITTSGSTTYTGAITTITGDFYANTATSAGGAIYNSATITTIGDSAATTADIFSYNSADQGGAIYNSGTITTIYADFSYNEGTGSDDSDGGGAIYNTGTIGSTDGGTYTGISGNFVGNTSSFRGGAIYTTGSMTFVADGADYKFTDNVASPDPYNTNEVYNAIYVTRDDSDRDSDIVLTFYMDDGSFTMNDTILGETEFSINIVGNSNSTDTFYLNAFIGDLDANDSNATVTINNATLELGTYTHADGTSTYGDLMFYATLMGDNAILEIDVKDNVVMVGDDEDIAETLYVQSDDQFIITSGTFDISAGTLIVDAYKGSVTTPTFSTASGSTLIANITDFGYSFGSTTYTGLSFADTYTAASDKVTQTLTNAGELILVSDGNTINKTAYIYLLNSINEYDWIYGTDGTDIVSTTDYVTIKFTDLTLTGYYSLNTFSYTDSTSNVVLGDTSLNEYVMAGTLASGNTLMTSGLVANDIELVAADEDGLANDNNTTAIISAGATLTLTGANAEEATTTANITTDNVTATDATVTAEKVSGHVLVASGITVTNNGTLYLGATWDSSTGDDPAGVDYTSYFNGTLTSMYDTGETPTTAIYSSVIFANKTTVYTSDTVEDMENSALLSIKAGEGTVTMAGLDLGVGDAAGTTTELNIASGTLELVAVGSTNVTNYTGTSYADSTDTTFNSAVASIITLDTDASAATFSDSNIDGELHITDGAYLEVSSGVTNIVDATLWDSTKSDKDSSSCKISGTIKVTGTGTLVAGFDDFVSGAETESGTYTFEQTKLSQTTMLDKVTLTDNDATLVLDGEATYINKEDFAVFLNGTDWTAFVSDADASLVIAYGADSDNSNLTTENGTTLDNTYTFDTADGTITITNLNLTGYYSLDNFLANSVTSDGVTTYTLTEAVTGGELTKILVATNLIHDNNEATSTIESNASLTLTGATDNTTLLNSGTLTVLTSGTLVLGDASDSITDLTFNGTLTASGHVSITDNVTFTDANAISDINGELGITTGKILTVAAGIVDIVDINDANITGDGTIEITGNGTLITSYASVINDSGASATATNLAKQITIDGGTLELDLSENGTSISIDSSVLAGYLTDTAYVYSDFSQTDKHIAALSGDDGGTISFSGYDLTNNYLANFIATSGNSVDGYIVGTISDSSTAADNILADDTTLTAVKLFGIATGTFTIGETDGSTASLTLTGATGNTTLLHTGSLINYGSLTLGDASDSIDTLYFDGALTSTGTLTIADDVHFGLAYHYTSDIDGTLILADKVQLTISMGATVDIVDANLTVGDGASIYIGGGTLKAAYDSVIYDALAGKVILNADTGAPTLVLDGSTSSKTDVTSADYADKLDAVEGAYKGFTFADKHLTTFDDVDSDDYGMTNTITVGDSTITVTGFTLTKNYLSTFLTDTSTTEDNIVTYDVRGVLDGDIAYNATDGDENTLLADTTLIASTLNADDADNATFTIEKDASLTLCGALYGTEANIKYTFANASLVTNDGTLTLTNNSNNTASFDSDLTTSGSGTTTANGPITISGAVTSSGSTTFNGTATLTNTLTVTGGTTNFMSTATIWGAVESSGTLTFEGTTTLGNMFTDAATTILSVTKGNVTLGDDASDKVTIYGAVSNDGETTFGGAATISGAVTSSGTTTFNSTATLSSGLTVNDGTTTFNGATTTLGTTSTDTTTTLLSVGVDGEVILGDNETGTDTVDIYGAVSNLGTTTFDAETTIWGTVTNSNELTFNGAATLYDTLDITGGTTTFAADSSVTKATTVRDGAELSITGGSLALNGESDIDGALTISGGTLTLNADSDIEGTLTMSSGTTLKVASGTTLDITGATFNVDDTENNAANITIYGTVTASFSDFVDTSALSLDTTANLADNVTLTGEYATLSLDGNGASINKEEFAEFLNATDWTSFITESTGTTAYDFSIDYGNGATSDTDGDTTNNIYSFDTTSGTITITGLNLTDYYSLDHYLANSDTVYDITTYTLEEAVIGGTLASGVNLTASTLLEGTRAATINAGATLTLTGSGYTENGVTDTNADVLVTGGTVTNYGTLYLGESGVDYTSDLQFNGNLVTGTTTDGNYIALGETIAYGPITITGTVESSGITTFEKDATIADAVSSSGTLTFKGEADLDSTLTISGGEATFAGITTVDGLTTISGGITNFNGATTSIGTASTIDSTILIVGDSGNVTFGDAASDKVTIYGAVSNTNALTFNSTADITGAVESSGTLTFERNTNLDSGLTVSGGKTTFNGTITNLGTANTDTATTILSVGVDGTVAFGNSVGDVVNIYGAVSNSGTTTFAGSATIYGAVESSDTTTFNNLALLKSTLTVSGGTTTFNGITEVDGLTTISDGETYFNSNATLGTTSTDTTTTILSVANGATVSLGDNTSDTDKITIYGAVSNLGEMTFEGATTISGAVSGYGTLTFKDDADLDSTLTVEGGTTTFAAGGSVAGITTVSNSAELSITGGSLALDGTSDIDGALTISGGTLTLNDTSDIDGALTISGGSLIIEADSDIDGTLTMSSGTSLVVNSGTTDITGATLWDKDGDSTVSGTITITDDGTLTASFSDFVTGAETDSDDYEYSETELSLRTDLTDNVELTDEDATLELLGYGAYINKQDFAEFLSGTGEDSWGEFVTGDTDTVASYTIDYGSDVFGTDAFTDTDSATLDNVYTFDTGNGLITITDLYLTDSYSLSHYLANENGGVFELDEAVISGTLASGVDLTATILLQGSDQSSTIEDGATLTLTGEAYDGVDNVLVNGGTVVNYGDLILGDSTNSTLLTFTGDLITGSDETDKNTGETIAYGPITITGDVTNYAITTFEKDATITGAVSSSGTTTFKGEADLDSTLTVTDGTTTFEKDATITGAVSSSGTTTFKGEADLDSTLTISGGTTTFEQDVTIADVTTISGGITNFNGSATLGTDLTDAATTILSVTGGEVTFGDADTDKITIYGAVESSGTTTFNGETELGSTLTVTGGITTLAGETTVADLTTISGGTLKVDSGTSTITMNRVATLSGSTFDLASGTVILTAGSSFGGTLSMADGTGIEAQGIEVIITDVTATDTTDTTGTAPYIYATTDATGASSTITFADFDGILDFSIYADGESDLIFGTVPTSGDSLTEYAYILTELYGTDATTGLANDSTAILAAFEADNLLYIGSSSLNISNNANVVIGGSTTTTGSYFGENSVIMVDVVGVDAQNVAAIDGGSADGGGADLLVDESSTLALINAEDNEYIILDNFNSVTNSDGTTIAWDEDSIIVGNYLYVVDSINGVGTTDDPYIVSIRRNIPDAVYASDAAGLVADMVNSGAFNKDSKDPVVQFLYKSSVENADNPDQFLKDAASVTNAGHRSGSHTVGMTAVRNSAATFGVRDTVVHVGSVADAGGTLLVKDANGKVTAEYNNVLEVADGGSFSDAPAALGGAQASLANTIGVWAMPFYAHESISGAKVGSYENDMHTDMYGVTMGIDKTFTPKGIDICRFGFAFNMGSGETESYGETGNSVTDFDFYGVATYGSMRKGAATISGSLSYTHTEAEFDTGLVSGEPEGNVWYGILNGEYAFDMGALESTAFFSNFNFVPYVGIGFMSTSIDDYTTSAGAKVTTERQNVFTFPVGLKFNKEFELDSGWIVKPEIGVGAIIADGDLYQRSLSGNPYGSSLDPIKSQVMDQTTLDLDFNFDIRKDHFGLFLDYSLQKSETRTAHGISAKFEYRF